MKYFANINTLADLKTAYRKVASKLHPDKGGTDAEMQALNNEYDLLVKKLVKGENFAYSDSAFWQSETQHTEIEIKVREALEKIIHLDGLEIEIIGVWIWVGGNTKEHKEALKAAGFYWMKNKGKWAFQGKKSYGRGKMSLDEMRSKYGSETVSKKYQTALPA